MSALKICFEPWGLGDTIIAAAAVREMPSPVALACKTRWHLVLRAALGTATDLLPVDLPYSTADRRGHFDFGIAQPRFDSLDIVVASVWKWHTAHPNGYPD